MNLYETQRSTSLMVHLLCFHTTKEPQQVVWCTKGWWTALHQPNLTEPNSQSTRGNWTEPDRLGVEAPYMFILLTVCGCRANPAERDERSWLNIFLSKSPESAHHHISSNNITANVKQSECSLYMSHCWIFHPWLLVWIIGPFRRIIDIFSDVGRTPSHQHHSLPALVSVSGCFYPALQNRGSVYESRSPRQYQRCCWLFVKTKT